MMTHVSRRRRVQLAVASASAAPAAVRGAAGSRTRDRRATNVLPRRRASSSSGASRSRSACAGTPAGRLPRAEELRDAAQLRSTSAILNAVFVPPTIACDRRCAVLSRPPARDRGCVRLPRSRPTAAAKLKELREAKGPRLDQNHRRVRHVDADLDDRRGDEDVDRPRLEALHDGVLVVASAAGVHAGRLVRSGKTCALQRRAAMSVAASGRSARHSAPPADTRVRSAGPRHWSRGNV